MAKYQVLPTKTKLLSLKQELDFANQGYDVLEQKRQILIVELMRTVGRAEEAQRRADEGLEKAYNSLAHAIAAMGILRVQNASQSVPITTSISVSSRNVMGVPIPEIRLQVEDHPPYFGHGNESLWMDETVLAFKQALQRLVEFTEVKIASLRLAREVKKTVRRVNALDKIYIPDRRESVQYIESVLEEAERERFSAMKIIKARLSVKRGDEQT